MNTKKIDSILTILSLILAALSIVNFEKVLLIVCLIIAVFLFGYSIYKIIKKDPKVPLLVFSIVGMINTVLWIMFAFGIYEKMVS